MRELVDYDYDEELPEEARVWLGAFTEEHYKGWRLKGETQLQSLEQIRAADAERKRSQRARKTLDPIVMVTLDNIDAQLDQPSNESEMLGAMDSRLARKESSLLRLEREAKQRWLERSKEISMKDTAAELRRKQLDQMLEAAKKVMEIRAKMKEMAEDLAAAESVLLPQAA